MLTDLAVGALRATGKQYTTWDGESFGVRVSQSGTKTFIVMLGRERKRVSLGRYPNIKLKEARLQAKKLLLTYKPEASSTSVSDALATYEATHLASYREGTRSETGEIGMLKPGFLALMRRANVPVYPVGVAGTYQALPRGARFLRPVKVRVVFGEAFTPAELDRFGRHDEQELLNFIRERMIACQQDAERLRGGLKAKG